ncbi:MAG: TolC family protein [Solirubrobacterales bacterium]
MTRPIAVLFLAWAAMTSPVRAGAEQSPAPDHLRLTLAETVERARLNSPRLEQLRSLQQAADAGLRGAKAGRLPLLDLSAFYTRNSNVPEFVVAFPGSPPAVLFPNIPNNYGAHVGLVQPLYTGGRVGGRIAAAEHGLRAAGKDVEAGTSDLVLETITAYWSLVASRENARVLTESIASYEANLKLTQDRFDVGMAARNDVLNIQVERDRAELGRLQATSNAAVANVNLVRLLGLPPGSTIEPTEAVAAPASLPEEMEGLVAQALSNRPEIAGLRARADAAEAQIRVVRSATRPQASLNAGYDYYRPNLRILPPVDGWNDTWNVGVSLSIRAFDGGRTSAATAEAKAQADAARHQLDELERQVRLEVTARALDLSTRGAELDVAERSLGAARENVRVSQDRYREGLIPASELLDAETRLLRAGLDRTTAATTLRQARANLDRAVGR